MILISWSIIDLDITFIIKQERGLQPHIVAEVPFWIFTMSERKIAVGVSRHSRGIGHWRNRHVDWSVAGLLCGFLGFPSTNARIPPSLIFTALDVKAQCYLIANRKRVLVGTVAEEVEMDFFGICL